MNRELRLENFCAGYENKYVVNKISFTLENGKMTALLGANGSGKTTLLRGICSLIENNGMAFIGEQSIKALKNKQRSQYISYIPQNSSITFPISVIDTVLMGLNPQLKLLQFPSRTQQENALQILSDLELNDLYTANFLALSGGQKQLVILARSLVQNTPFLLFDEPDSALDFNNKHFVLEKVRKVLYNQNRAAILSLHDANFALRYCDRILLMKNGTMVGDFCPQTTICSKIESNLRKIYHNIKVIQDSDCYIMIKENCQ